MPDSGIWSGFGCPAQATMAKGGQTLPFALRLHCIRERLLREKNFLQRGPRRDDACCQILISLFARPDSDSEAVMFANSCTLKGQVAGKYHCGRIPATSIAGTNVVTPVSTNSPSTAIFRLKWHRPDTPGSASKSARVA